MNKLLISLTILISLVGCKSKEMYHWGNYSHSLYNYTNEPSPESRIQHKAELEKIIALAAKKKKPVPPSIHFELAMLEAEDGNKQQAIALLEQEKSLFPESHKTIELMLKEIEAL